MQTFFPLPSLKESAAVLDDQRLNCQVKEADQILDVLVLCRKHWGTRHPDGQHIAWSTHPAVLQWVGHEWLLIAYRNTMRNERLRRGQNEQRPLVGQIGFEPAKPWWHGDDRYHSSHRAALLAKDFVHYSQFNWHEQPALEYFWPVKHNERCIDEN
jgi:hypothetical protein